MAVPDVPDELDQLPTPKGLPDEDAVDEARAILSALWLLARDPPTKNMLRAALQWLAGREAP